MRWKLQEAKKRLSEVVEKALSEGPQTITRRGRPAVVIVASEQYAPQTGQEKLSTILRTAPPKGGWHLATRTPDALSVLN